MIAAVFAAALMAAAPAAQPATSDAKPAKAAKATGNDLVCKKEAVVGSRMKQRVCLTQAEWDQREVDAKDQLDAAQRNRPLPSN
ncbi:hypothetical protein [Phenylobacterium sp.]|uniref:hypothetical protein n=1 Tax=Phenylobacterium sp. TaxID=1871053 RepID=UPI002EDAC73C